MRHWRTLARRVVYSQLPWLEVALEQVELPDGRVIDDFIQLRGRDFVVVVPFTTDGRIVAERAYKHGIRRVALALPAGLLEPGEAPLEAARRELLEETGYAAERWTALGSYVVDSNYGLNTEHVFVADGATKVREPESGDDEEIEVLLVGTDEMLAALRRGDIAQLSSAAALGIALSTRPPVGR